MHCILYIILRLESPELGKDPSHPKLKEAEGQSKVKQALLPALLLTAAPEVFPIAVCSVNCHKQQPICVLHSMSSYHIALLYFMVIFHLCSMTTNTSELH